MTMNLKLWGSDLIFQVNYYELEDFYKQTDKAKQCWEM